MSIPMLGTKEEADSSGLESSRMTDCYAKW